jgi:methanogenic corrinoid protein MtbC1
MAKDLVAELERAVLEMDESLARYYAIEVLALQMDVADAVNRGLIVGIKKVGERYDRAEIYLPQALASANAFYAAYEILRPHMLLDTSSVRKTVIIGVIEGDIHDIGKNLVKLMIEAHGYHCLDLGRDVLVEAFLEGVEQSKADYLAMSTLMTPTMGGMRQVIEGMEEAGTRRACGVMVGGGPIDECFAAEIGADFYGPDEQAAIAWLKSREG